MVSKAQINTCLVLKKPNGLPKASHTVGRHEPENAIAEECAIIADGDPYAEIVLEDCMRLIDRKLRWPLLWALRNNQLYGWRITYIDSNCERNSRFFIDCVMANLALDMLIFRVSDFACWKCGRIWDTSDLSKEALCNRQRVQLKRCEGCCLVGYCSRECQRADFDSHFYLCSNGRRDCRRP